METGDEPEKDKRKLGRIINTLNTYPGNDSFSVVFRIGDIDKTMRFPGKTTQICDALLADLRDIVGAEEYITVADADA